MSSFVQLRNTRIPELDGLRGVSILLVFLSHAWLQKYIPGGFGVAIFFFISGFIITKLMLGEFEESGSISMRAFYLRRIFRLMPALIVFTAICVGALLHTNVSFGWLEIVATLFFFSNYLTIYGDHALIGWYSPLSIAWSLAIEEHFYLLWPVAFILLMERKHDLVKFVIALVVAVLAWRCYLVFGVGLDRLPHYRLYKASDTRFDAILFGVVFALLANDKIFKEIKSKRVFFLIGLGFLASGFLIRDNEFRESFRYSVQGLGLFFVFQNLIDPKSFSARILRTDFLQFFGKISYSLYLYHWLVFVLVQHNFGDYPFVFRVALMLPLSVLLAWASWRWVERPGLQFGRQFIASRN